MDFDFTSLIFLIPCSVLVFVFVFVFVLSETIKPKLNLPPGPRKLPFIGNLHLLGGSDSPHLILRNLATKYGPLMHLQLGEVGAVVISSPETVKEFYKTNGVVFASRPSSMASEIILYGNTDIGFAPYGDYWRQLRKIFTLELLTAKRVQSLRPVREEEASDLCKSVALNAGSTINLTEKIGSTNLNIMFRAAFGEKNGQVAILKSIFMDTKRFLTFFNILDVYPSFKFLRPLSRLKREIEKHHRQLNRITECIIEERKRRRADADGGEINHRNLLDELLRLQGDGSLQIPLTTDNIKSVLLDGAGVELSTTAADWAMAEMLKNPRVLKKAQDEVRGVFDVKNYVDERCFEELNYLKLVIKETLRLHPPAPILLPRESRECCKINGYEIPAKTWVLVNAWAIGRYPKYWEDAETFKPERFLENSVDFKASRLEFIPFGAGRRICPGIAFGIANIEIQVAMLLYHFDWILPNGMKSEELDMKESCGRRKYDLTVIPIIRRPLV